MDEAQAVQAMVDRLRDLQATGETELAYRTISVGEGLEGGGDLTADRTISLSQATRNALQRAAQSVSTAGLEEALRNYMTTQDMVQRLNDYQLKRDAHRIWTVPYTYPGTLTQEVQAPPLVAVGSGTITSVGIAASTAGAEVVVTLGGRQYRLAQGTATVLHEVGVPISAGGPINLTVASTNATGVTVHIRVQENMS